MSNHRTYLRFICQLPIHSVIISFLLQINKVRGLFWKVKYYVILFIVTKTKLICPDLHASICKMDVSPCWKVPFK